MPSAMTIGGARSDCRRDQSTVFSFPKVSLSNECTSAASHNNLNAVVAALPAVGSDAAAEHSSAPSYAWRFIAASCGQARCDSVRTASTGIFHAECRSDRGSTWNGAARIATVISTNRNVRTGDEARHECRSNQQTKFLSNHCFLALVEQKK